MPLTEAALNEALKSVVDPNTGVDFVSGRQIRSVVIEGRSIRFDVDLAYPARSQHEALRQALIAAVRALSLIHI
mgnify:CR=1 FL=1